MNINVMTPMYDRIGQDDLSNIASFMSMGKMLINSAHISLDVKPYLDIALGVKDGSIIYCLRLHNAPNFIDEKKNRADYLFELGPIDLKLTALDHLREIVKNLESLTRHNKLWEEDYFVIPDRDDEYKLQPLYSLYTLNQETGEWIWVESLGSSLKDATQSLARYIIEYQNKHV